MVDRATVLLAVVDEGVQSEVRSAIAKAERVLGHLRAEQVKTDLDTTEPTVVSDDSRSVSGSVSQQTASRSSSGRSQISVNSSMNKVILQGNLDLDVLFAKNKDRAI